MTATISQVDVFHIEVPLVGTFTSGGLSKTMAKGVVVRVTATDGALGTES